MAHPIAVAIDKADGKTPVTCNEKCKYWKFPRLETACELSEIFSVKQGEPCYIFENKLPLDKKR